MSVSERKKISNAKWDKENMATLGCRVRKEEATAFKKYAAKQGKTANTVLKEYVIQCINENCGDRMPILARFYGLVIKMYCQQSEHNPPHIHCVYGDCVGVIDIQTRKMIEGDLPAKALSMVQEWTAQHKAALLNMWNTQEFKQLPPLE